MAKLAKILTVSDSVSRGTREDLSGDVLAGTLAEHGFEVLQRRVVPDGVDSGGEGGLGPRRATSRGCSSLQVERAFPRPTSRPRRHGALSNGRPLAWPNPCVPPVRSDHCRAALPERSVSVLS